MSVRKTVKWLLLIVALLAAGGGGYGYWRWSNANRVLLQTLREELADAAPGWNIEVESARFDWHRRIHIFNLTLKSPDGRATLLRVPEAVLVVDRDKLADSLIVDVQRVRLIGPEVHLVRDARGRWNWQDLPPLKKAAKERSLPEIVIENATVHARLRESRESRIESREPGRRISVARSGSGLSTLDSRLSGDTVIHLRDGALQLVPESRRRFVLRGSTTVRDAGKLAFSGRWDLDTRAWSLDGKMQNVAASGELLALAVGVSPELRSHVARLQESLRDVTPPDERPKIPAGSRAVPNFGASATVDVSFQLAKRKADEELQFDLRAKVRQGRFRNPVLPVELHELAADVHWNNHLVEIRNVSAQNGSLRLAGEAVIRRVGDKTPVRARFQVSNLPLNDALEKRLPADWRPYYRKVTPRGSIDLSGTLEYDGREWSHHGCVLTTRDCSFAHTDFPYRFTRVNGTVTQHGDELTLKFRGLAGRQPATLTGWVKNPGPDAASRYVLTITDFQLDEALLAACKPNVRKTLKSLGADGQADVVFTADDPGGRTSVARLRLDARLKNCTLDYDRFPYRFTRLNGRVLYDSKTDVWTFSNLTAINGPGSFTGSGFLSEERGKSHLELTVTGIGASLDKPLYRALPKSLQELWADLAPTGILDLTVGLNWTEGTPVRISVPRCRVTKGTMTVQSFPYVFENILANFAYEDGGKLWIHSFQARHDDTLIRAEGFAGPPPGGGWRLRLTKFLADDLVPDRTFRRALNKDLRSVVEELDPDGPLSVTGMIEFRGSGKKKDPVTAAWDVKLVLTGTSLNFGVKLKDVHGRVYLKGTWNGRLVDMWSYAGNRFDLDSINVHGYQFTKVKGPFALYDKRLVVGTRDVFRQQRPGEKPPTIDREKQLTASAIGGEFTLNAEAWFGKQTTYRLIATMSKGRLERFARRYLKGAKNLKGVMYGRVELQGKGKSTRTMTGGGKLLISPAALYELPVLVQIFNVMNFVPVDKTAFKFAFADFDVKDRMFRFRTIDLVGDSISLRGRGTVLFDGKLTIDFYSMVTRSRVPVEVVRQLLKSATSGWVGVKVRGTVSQPRAEIRPVPQVDDAMKQFLNALGGPPTNVLPWFQPPPQSQRRGYPRR